MKTISLFFVLFSLVIQAEAKDFFRTYIVFNFTYLNADIGVRQAIQLSKGEIRFAPDRTYCKIFTVTSTVDCFVSKDTDPAIFIYPKQIIELISAAAPSEAQARALEIAKADDPEHDRAIVFFHRNSSGDLRTSTDVPHSITNEHFPSEVVDFVPEIGLPIKM